MVKTTIIYIKTMKNNNVALHKWAASDIPFGRQKCPSAIDDNTLYKHTCI